MASRRPGWPTDCASQQDLSWHGSTRGPLFWAEDACCPRSYPRGGISGAGRGSPRAPPRRPAPCLTRSNIRTIQGFAVAYPAVRELLLGPFLVSAPLRRHLGHNPQSRFPRSKVAGESSLTWGSLTRRLFLL